ncbi:uncharacterized protein LOC552171 isoform X2 [Apis mellifera]|uniref:Uncharacterized protein LOC552171 isoform X2 n=1 Tax=Apis mellifera TaxID=7460 RepID=A0A7M7L0M8_APIME|nr:uncharacterized protein LOC552171 isoform X2 [Apis mellifera]|eukprot:XP_026295843.1 uncharacterized protein LOC552171 isoform X2 [Apis mellifera]
MGACFGRCISKVTDSLSYRFYQRHTSMSYQGDEQVEFIDDKGGTDQSRGSKTLLSFLSLNRFKKKNGIPVTLELLEDGAWSKGKTNKYARLNSRNDASTSSGLDTPLQILDARTLMKQQACVSSTPGSSLDLEWEHEGMPLPIMDDEKVESTDGSMTQTSVNNSQPSSLTASPWSRVSTPNSLEWDPVEADMIVILARRYLCLAAGSGLTLSYFPFS